MADSTHPDEAMVVRWLALAFASKVDELADRVAPPSAAAAELHLAAVQLRAAIAAIDDGA
jgi:hypothetical protein